MRGRAAAEGGCEKLSGSGRSFCRVGPDRDQLLLQPESPHLLAGGCVSPRSRSSTQPRSPPLCTVRWERRRWWRRCRGYTFICPDVKPHCCAEEKDRFRRAAPADRRARGRFRSHGPVWRRFLIVNFFLKKLSVRTLTGFCCCSDLARVSHTHARTRSAGETQHADDDEERRHGRASG